MAHHTKFTFDNEKYPEDLARTVERRMKDGWTPLGAPVWQTPYVGDGGKTTVEGWYQFMTRE